jgi:hypothetical protein
MYQTRTHKRSIMMLIGIMASFLGYSQGNGNLLLSPQKARLMAVKDLNKTLQWVDPQYLGQYGFSTKDDLSAITIGLPLYQFSFYAESVINADDRKELSQDAVLLPLLLDGSVRCFIYIMDDGKGNWAVSGIGGAHEAHTWSPLIIRAQTEKQYDHLSFVHLVQNNADYLLHAGSGNYEDISVGKYHRGQQEARKSIGELYTEAVQLARDARALTSDMSN